MALLISLVSTYTFAQDNADEPPKKTTKSRVAILRPKKCPKAYITTSTGINNNTGLVGFNFDIPFAGTYAIDAGAGISSWGYKMAIAGKYYFSPCQRGWAIGLGFTQNTGIDKYTGSMETVSGTTEQVEVDLHPQTNLFLSAYHYWNLGKRYNRFYTQFGWSIPLSGGDRYKQVGGNPISESSRNTLDLLAPHGLIAAVGFSFGIY